MKGALERLQQHGGVEKCSERLSNLRRIDVHLNGAEEALETEEWGAAIEHCEKIVIWGGIAGAQVSSAGGECY